MSATPHDAGSGSVEGQVAGRIQAGGQPRSEATVMVVEGSAEHADLAALSNEDGRYQLDGLAAGWYVIEARLGDRSLRRRVELAPGQAARVDFSFQ